MMNIAHCPNIFIHLFIILRHPTMRHVGSKSLTKD